MRDLTRAPRWLVSPSIAVTLVAVAACGGGGNDASLSGKIMDSAGQALPGAVVVVGNGSRRTSVVAAHDGTYSLNNVATGNTPVHVFAPGFVYDPGHNLKSLNSGDNAYDVRLKPQPAGRGPSFTADPTITSQGSSYSLQAPLQAGPGSPVGDELLAVDVTDGFAVLLTAGGSGTATGSIAKSKVHSGAQWLFIATDDACQESPTFPSAQTPA
ncbi:MAG: carboxypeptidase regulatory-like domain-containing protein [Candidatus Dormibacteraeota bacterium]|nr:carboxypeptidase regulatory-like domain-containing protein [Candidatus Dormibacteraeota bacterium]